MDARIDHCLQRILSKSETSQQEFVSILRHRKVGCIRGGKIEEVAHLGQLGEINTVQRILQMQGNWDGHVLSSLLSKG